MRNCKTAEFICPRSDKPCCADCGREGCSRRCENDPDRCGCWEDVEPPKRGTHRKFDWEEMARLRDQGMNAQAIAQRLGCARETVNSALRTMERRKRS